MKVLNIPITFLSNAVRKVYYQTVAEMKRKGEKIGEYTLRNINRVTKLAILPMIVLLSFSDIVCTIFLGPNFLIAGQITRIVAFNSFFSFLMMSTQGISIVLKKQKYTFVSAISQIIGYVVGLIIGKYIFSSVYVGCFIMTITFCCAQVCYFSAIFRSEGISIKRYLASVFRSVAIIIIGAAVVRILGNMVGLLHGV